jgi:hypothetical protein
MVGVRRTQGHRSFEHFFKLNVRRICIRHMITCTNFSPRLDVSLYLTHDHSLPFHAHQEKGKKDHESNWLDRAMRCKAKEMPPKMQ